MELSFNVTFKTEVIFLKKISELKNIIGDDSLVIVDRKVLERLPIHESDCFQFDGEKSKDLEHVESCIEWLIEKKATRKTTLFVIGGGATTDFGAFVGSIYHRGQKVVLIPTTILGAVDSAIGGKTAVNFVAKNSIGSFYPAEKVMIVEEFFKTLPKDVVAGGKAEIIKVMLLAGKEDKLLIDKVDLLSEKNLDQAIYDKYSIIVNDLDDTLGRRVFLNWGHTFGHAIERYYGLSHGLAVANGMVLIQKYAKHLGFKCFDHKNLERLFEKHDINVNTENYLLESSWKKFIKFDKKRDLEEISLVYLEKSGCPRIINMNLNDILKDLEEMR